MNKKIRIYSFENQKNKFVSIIRIFLYCKIKAKSLIKLEIQRNLKQPFDILADEKKK